MRWLQPVKCGRLMQRTDPAAYGLSSAGKAAARPGTAPGKDVGGVLPGERRGPLLYPEGVGRTAPDEGSRPFR